MISTAAQMQAGRFSRMVAVVLAVVVLSGCSLFGQPKISEEEIIPADTLYQTAMADIERQYFVTAITHLERLDRQHPTSALVEDSKRMQVYANFRSGRYPEAVLAADRYLAVYPNGREADYVLHMRASSLYGQITDTTRDQSVAQEAIEAYNLLISRFPNSQYVPEARDRLVIAYDQLAGREMSVGRYYVGNGQYTAGINRFRVVVEQYQTSTHIEEALYRLTESYLALGLLNEARTAAAVLGHNYPSSTWYQSAYQLLQRQGLTPERVNGNWISSASL